MPAIAICQSMTGQLRTALPGKPAPAGARCPGTSQKGARLNAGRGTRDLLVQSQLTPLSTRTACGSKKLGGAMPGMYWSETNMRQRSANADTTRDSWVLLAVA